MDEPLELQSNRHSRMAVWALRVGYFGLADAIAGRIAMSLGSTPWLLAVRVIIWLAASAVTLTGPRPPRPAAATAPLPVLRDHLAGHVGRGRDALLFVAPSGDHLRSNP